MGLRELEEGQVLAALDVDAVEQEGVGVGMSIQGTAKALKECDAPGMGLADSREAEKRPWPGPCSTA